MALLFAVAVPTARGYLTSREGLPDTALPTFNRYLSWMYPQFNPRSFLVPTMARRMEQQSLEEPPQEEYGGERTTGSRASAIVLMIVGAWMMTLAMLDTGLPWSV